MVPPKDDLEHLLLIGLRELKLIVRLTVRRSHLGILLTDATAACMVISEDIYAMLLTEPKFKEFTSKPIANAKEATEVLVCLSQESKAKVNEIVDAAVHTGAVEARPAMDYGFMFGRSFHDLDGHIWEIIWMDPAA